MSHTNDHGQPIGFPVADWTSARLPTRQLLSGQFVRMQRATDTTVCAALFDAYIKDSKGENWTYLPYGPFATLEKFTQWFEQTCLADDPFFYIVFDKSTGLAVGIASFLRINPIAGSIEVGHIHFSPLLQRTPMATDAMFLMMREAFDELKYRRYEWKCDALNKPSMDAARRLGFTYEGTFRQATTYKQRNRDTAWFSITDKEWSVVKAGFERWLQPENFSSAGVQKLSLARCREILSKS